MKTELMFDKHLLTEANRQQLLNKSRNAKEYSLKNQSKGKNRYLRRTKSQIAASVRDYNIIDMNKLFKEDILYFEIPVKGETANYKVSIEIKNVLKEIQKTLATTNGKLEFKTIITSLTKVLNTGDVFVGCNCFDARYRMAYQQTKGNYKAGYKETRPSDITNPNDNLGAGCKHVLLVLSNLSWVIKVSSVINNYIKYSRAHLQRNYTNYIFPKVFGMTYEKAKELQLFCNDEDSGLLPSDQKTISSAIDMGMSNKDAKGRFVAKPIPKIPTINNSSNIEEPNNLQ